MKKFFVFLIFISISQISLGQNKYWVFLKDKGNFTTNTPYVSPQTLKNRVILQLPLYQFTDVPVATSYKENIQQFGIEILQASKWLNAVSAYLTANQINAIQSLSFIEAIIPIQTYSYPTALGKFEAEAFTTALEQMQAANFTQKNLSGEGMLVGVIDAGFYGAKNEKSLKHLFDEGKILGFKDYVNRKNTDGFEKLETSSDFHGTEVLKMIAGFNESSKMQYGFALNAQYYLARTDHGVEEARKEEDNWIAAMEWMDSLGVRVINTSLGYALNFTDPKENYKPIEMNGKTSKISKAAEIAWKEKGMTLVISAGNEGDNEAWAIVSTPGDTEAAISVGATKSRLRSKMYYSSIGTDIVDYLKPNVSCYSSNGTSFSAPVITGFATCLLQKNPKLTNNELKDLIEKSAHLYPYGNNYVGYGIPQANRALDLLENPALKNEKVLTHSTKGKTFTVENISTETLKAVVFHKKDKRIVLNQQELEVKNGQVIIERIEGATYSTIDAGDKIIELKWE